MRKKSHISLTRYLIETMDQEQLRKHKKAFYVGSILPDCQPTFLTRRHTFEDTFPILVRQLYSIVEDSTIAKEMNGKFCRRLGVITHYLADYFTFPHNVTFDGNIREHCIYEKELKFRLRDYVMDQRSRQVRSKIARFESVEDVIHYIRETHRQYLDVACEIKEDIEYIVGICFQVVDGILHLIELREQNLIPEIA